VIGRVMIAVGLIAGWETIVAFGLVSPLLLASPSQIWSVLLSDGPRFLQGMSVTTLEIAIATAIAWCTGITFGLVVGTRPLLARASAPILTSLFAVPMKIFYPIFLAWLGLGMGSKIAYAAIAGFFPLALSVMHGVAAIDRAYVNMARAMGASRLQIHFSVMLPLALPAIASGLRLSCALVVFGVLGTEILASMDGIGYLISLHQATFDTAHVYLGIVMALALVAAISAGLTRLERALTARTRPASTAVRSSAQRQLARDAT